MAVNFANLTSPQFLSVFDNVLGNAVSPTQGAGAIGYGGSVAYTIGTVGWAVNNLRGIAYYGLNGAGDDGPPLMALANANPNSVIINATGGALQIYSTVTITADGVWLDLNGGSINQNTQNIDSIVFQPPTAGVTAAFRNGGGLRNGSVNHNLVAAGATSGWALNLTQCNGIRIRDVVFNDGDVSVFGGQLSSATGCDFFSSTGGYKGSGSANIHFQDAPYGSGQWQKCFTFTVDNWKGSSTLLRDALFRIHSGDGILIGKGYGGFALNAIVLLWASRAGSYISSCSVVGAYLDCVSPTAGTLYGIELRADSFSTSPIYSFNVAATTVGNGQAVGLIIRKVESYAVGVVGGQTVNMQSWAVDSQPGGSTLDLSITGHYMNNNGTVSGGDVRASGGRSLTYTGNTHVNSSTVCLSIGGTWRSAAVTGNNNATGNADDISYVSATFTNPIAFAGNNSTYSAASVQNSWVGANLNVPTYANNAAAVAAGLKTGCFYRTANGLFVV